MPTKKYFVELSSEERDELKTLMNKGKAVAYQRRHAEILLKADQREGGPSWPDHQIVEALRWPPNVERVRQRLVGQGLQAAIERATPKLLNWMGAVSFKLVVTVCPIFMCINP